MQDESASSAGREPPEPTESRIRELEREFRRAGVPNFAEGYRATEDVFTRAIPVLTLVFVFEMLGAINLEWDSVALNALAFVGGVGIMLGAFGGLNALRGRPFLSIPERVGVPELTAFVLLPGLLPLIFGGQWRSALVTLAVQLAILGLVFLVIGFGLFPILRWTGGRFVSQLAASLSLLVRALPLLLFFSLVTFFTNEYWQMFGLATDELFWAAIVLFLGLAVLFLLVRLPQSVRELERESDVAGRPLTQPQRINVGFVIVVSQALQVAFVALAVWIFFMVFGALLVSAPIRESWLGIPGTELFRLPFLGGGDIVVTLELVRASIGVASFSALYYTVAMLLDSTYRDEFVTRITEEMRQTFAARAEYLRLLPGSAGEPETVPTSADRRAG